VIVIWLTGLFTGLRCSDHIYKQLTLTMFSKTQTIRTNLFSIQENLFFLICLYIFFLFVLRFVYLFCIFYTFQSLYHGFQRMQLKLCRRVETKQYGKYRTIVAVIALTPKLYVFDRSTILSETLQQGFCDKLEGGVS